MVLYESHRFLGIGAEVASVIAEEGFESLDAPIVRVAPPNVPVPFSPTLEDAYLVLMRVPRGDARATETRELFGEMSALENVLVGLHHTFGANLISETRLGFTKAYLARTSDGDRYSKNYAAELGLKNLAGVPGDFTEPSVTLSEYAPGNPNGSAHNIAGICNRARNVVGLMPHPERYLHWTQHPRWTRLSAAQRKGDEALEQRILSDRYGDRFEYHDKVRLFLQEVQFYTNADLLLNDLNALFVKTIRVRSYQIILLDESTHVFTVFRSHPKAPPTQLPELRADSPIFQLFQNTTATYLAFNLAYIMPGETATVELVMALEEEFNISVPEEDLEGIATVDDAYNLVLSKLG